MNPIYDRIFAPHQGSGRPFLIAPEGGALSYGDFLARAASLAHGLRAAGLAPGDRLAVQLEKSAEALALYVAAIQAGVIYLPLNTGYTPEELSYFLGDSGAGLFLCDPGKEPALRDMAEGHGCRIETLGADGAGSFAALSSGQTEPFPTAPRAPGDLAAFLYTSGTTGRSKGAMLSHENLLSNALCLTDLWGFGPEDVLLHALPIFHTHGLFVATNILALAGGAMIFMPRFDAAEALRLMRRASSMMGVPTFYTRLLGETEISREDCAHMRLFISGSAPLLPETHRLFEARCGHRILERYGMTETNMITSNPLAGERRAGTVGLPLPGIELRICDEAGREVPRGETGMIELRGPNVFQGYWQMPEKTAADLRADGFFITGDLGQQDAEGYVTLIGRAKDLVISGGYNVYPREIEALLDDQPGVRESAVIGAPHPDFGEAVLAVIVPEPGFDEAALRRAMEPLARFKHPKAYRCLDALPRNTMGKVQKAALRRQFEAVFAGGAA